MFKKNIKIILLAITLNLSAFQITTNAMNIHRSKNIQNSNTQTNFKNTTSIRKIYLAKRATNKKITTDNDTKKIENNLKNNNSKKELKKIYKKNILIGNKKNSRKQTQNSIKIMGKYEDFTKNTQNNKNTYHNIIMKNPEKLRKIEENKEKMNKRLKEQNRKKEIIKKENNNNQNISNYKKFDLNDENYDRIQKDDVDLERWKNCYNDNNCSIIEKNDDLLDQSNISNSENINENQENSYLMNNEWVRNSSENNNQINSQEEPFNGNNLGIYFYENSENNNQYSKQSLCLDKTADQTIDYEVIEEIENLYNNAIMKYYKTIIQTIYKDIETLENAARKRYKNLSFEEIKIVDQYHYNKYKILKELSSKEKIPKKSQYIIDEILYLLSQKNSQIIDVIKESLQNKKQILKKIEIRINEIKLRYQKILRDYEINLYEYKKNINENILKSESTEKYFYTQNLADPNTLTKIYKNFKESCSIIEPIKRDIPYLKECKNKLKEKRHGREIFLEGNLNINEDKMLDFYVSNKNIILNKLYQLNSDINFLRKTKHNIKRNINRKNIKYYANIISLINTSLEIVNSKRIQEGLNDLIYELNNITLKKI